MDESGRMVRGAAEDGPHPVDRHVGRRVCEKRIALGYNQSDLGRALGLTFQQIQKYENGANRISFSRLVQIARALRCRVVDLMDVLDTPAGEGDVDLLSRMRTPGALELLTAFERLPQEARSSLVNLLRVMTDPDAGQKSRQKELA